MAACSSASTGFLHFAPAAGCCCRGEPGFEMASAPATPCGAQYGNFLVRVRAQVMTRDEFGWVPMGGGGLSNVSVRKRVPVEEDAKPEYLICGKRISDQTIVLSCAIKKDFQYNKVMPTFHHWRTEDKKFGLTFQTAADARAFDKGVRNAVDDLTDGIGCGQHSHDVGDDEVFMTLDLPVDSRSSSGSSSESGNGINAYRPTSATSSVPGGGDTSTTSSPYSHHHATNQQQHLYRIHYVRTSRATQASGTGSNGGGLAPSLSAGSTELQKAQQGDDIWVKESSNANESEKIELSNLGEPYSYVQFSKDNQVGDYCYPSIDALKSGGRQQLKKPHLPLLATVGSEPPLLPSKAKGGQKDSRPQSPLGRQQCRHCLDLYTEDENRAGSCEYGPDRTLTCIDHATCFSCAQCMLYHCVSDEDDGQFDRVHPCSCSGPADDHCRRRWTGLAVLSLFVPCLWCYLPLRACHRCGVRCGYCGGKHEPA